MGRLLPVLLALAVAASSAAAEDSWEKRLADRVARLEAEAAALDRHPVAAGLALDRRIQELDGRVGAIEERARRPKGSVSLEQGPRHLPSLTDAVVALEERVRLLRPRRADPAPRTEVLPTPPPRRDPPAKPPPVAPKPKRVPGWTTSYDRVDDTTAVRTTVSVLRSNTWRPALAVEMSVVVPGNDLAKAERPETVTFRFTSRSQEWRYHGKAVLGAYAQPDELRTTYAGSYSGQPVTDRVWGGLVVEDVTFTVPWADFATWASSTRLVLRLGTGTEIEWRGVTLPRLRALGDYFGG